MSRRAAQRRSRVGDLCRLALVAAYGGLGGLGAAGPQEAAPTAAPASAPVPAPAPGATAAPPAAPVPKPAPRPVADARWCGIETVPAVEPAPSCKIPTLPCGPIGAEQIHRGSGEHVDDLDGDGRPDLTVGGRLDATRPESFAAIYRSAEAGGFVLSDFRVLPPHTEPSFASVVLAQPGSAPLVRDGHDSIETGGRTLTHARLRRFDGQRFRTLLSFCAHRVEPGSPTREGHNRADLIDVDKDGTKEVVVQGLLRPVVYRFTEGGLGLIEDAGLTQRFRDGSPEVLRSKALRAEAAKLAEGNQPRRAAETLLRAFLLTPHDLELGLELVAALLPAGQPERALEITQRLSFMAPERAAVRCVAAPVHRALGDAASELQALRTCAADETDESLRAAAAARLRELQPPPPAPAPDTALPLPPPPPSL